MIIIAVQFKKTGVVSASGEGVNPNLILNSSIYVENDSYNTKNYTLDSDLVASTTYTVVMKGKLDPAKQYYGLWMGGGYTGFGAFTDLGDGIYYKSFVFGGTVAGNQKKNEINIYAVPSVTAGTNSIQYIKLEKGSVATPWIPNEADPEYVGSSLGFTEADGNSSIGKAGYVQATDFIEW